MPEKVKKGFLDAKFKVFSQFISCLTSSSHLTLKTFIPPPPPPQLSTVVPPILKVSDTGPLFKLDCLPWVISACTSNYYLGETFSMSIGHHQDVSLIV